ncbi:MAG: hypothetical protein KKA19_06815 [Candidatus Margulisbacteria bacterium]|nr:hypothetical protein [Candidatus Margulisiibacteriota bacterium]
MNKINKLKILLWDCYENRKEIKDYPMTIYHIINELARTETVEAGDIMIEFFALPENNSGNMEYSMARMIVDDFLMNELDPQKIDLVHKRKFNNFLKESGWDW